MASKHKETYIGQGTKMETSMKILKIKCFILYTYSKSIPFRTPFNTYLRVCNKFSKSHPPITVYISVA